MVASNGVAAQQREDGHCHRQADDAERDVAKPVTVIEGGDGPLLHRVVYAAQPIDRLRPACRDQPPRDESIDKGVDLQNRETDECRRHVAADLRDTVAGGGPIVVEAETESSERR